MKLTSFGRRLPMEDDLKVEANWMKSESTKISNEEWVAENRNISEIDFQEINTAGPQLARDNAKYYEQMERVSERVGVRKSARGVSQDGVRLESEKSVGMGQMRGQSLSGWGQGGGWSTSFGEIRPGSMDPHRGD